MKKFLYFFWLNIILTIIFFTNITHQYTSVSKSWKTTNLIKAGTARVITTGMQGTTSYVLTFSSAFTTVPGFIFGIKTYKGQDTLLKVQFQVYRSSITSTSATITVQVFGNKNIYTLDVSYIGIDPTFPYHINVIDSTPLSLTLRTTANFTNTFTNTFNYSLQTTGRAFTTFPTPLTDNTVILFLNCLSFANKAGTKVYTPSLITSTTINSASSYTVNVNLIIDTSVSLIKFMKLAFNKVQIQSTGLFSVYYQNYYISSMAVLNNKSIPSQLISNLIFGLNQYTMTAQICAIDYQWEYDSTNTSISIYISLPVSTGMCGTFSSKSHLFYTISYQCPTGYPYYNITSDLCQNLCADYYYQNITSSTCGKCYYGCIDCTSTSFISCTACESSTFRTLNTSTNSCPCNNGYFDDGYSSTCRLCNNVITYCATCQYTIDSTLSTDYYKSIFSSSTWTTDILVNFTCTLCDTPYFYNSSGKACQLCTLNYCTTCVSISACSVCNSSQLAVKYTDNLCYLCTISQCTMCSSDNICATCSSGYILYNNTCTTCALSCSCDGWVFPKLSNGTCSTLCGDNYLRGTQQCDDNNTNSHDGCSSICKIESCSQNCSCDGWVLPWVSSNNSCTTVCGDGYLRSIQQCDDNNTNSHDGCSSICKIQSCSQNCSCDGWVLPWVTSNTSCSTLCGDGFLRDIQQCDDGNINSHDGCSSLCKVQSCIQNCSCDGWVLPWVSSNSSCSTFCGDNYLRGIQQCDDGNTNSHDGCSSLCIIQTCSQNCSCDGWVSPWLNTNNACSTLCGDDFIRGTQQCDDSNTNSHDGCSSSCKIQSCSQNCSCDGWSFPLINNNTQCSTICSDGLKRGSQQCDDSNVFNNDSCSDQCKFLYHQIPEYFITQSQSFYPSFILFLMGFRIIGMQMLSVLQHFHLVLQNYNDSTYRTFQISDNIHGFNNESYLPFSPNQEINNPTLGKFSYLLWKKYNFMFFLALLVFILGILLRIVGYCMQKKGAKIQNEFKKRKNKNKSKSKNKDNDSQQKLLHDNNHNNQQQDQYSKNTNKNLINSHLLQRNINIEHEIDIEKQLNNNKKQNKANKNPKFLYFPNSQKIINTNRKDYLNQTLILKQQQQSMQRFQLEQLTNFDNKQHKQRITRRKGQNFTVHYKHPNQNSQNQREQLKNLKTKRQSKPNYFDNYINNKILKNKKLQKILTNLQQQQSLEDRNKQNNQNKNNSKLQNLHNNQSISNLNNQATQKSLIQGKLSQQKSTKIQQKNNNNQQQQNYQQQQQLYQSNQPLIIRISNILLYEVLFLLLINCLNIVLYSIFKQMLNNNGIIQNGLGLQLEQIFIVIIYFILLIGIFLLIIIGRKKFYTLYYGEIDLKFKQTDNKVFLYWASVIIQKAVYVFILSLGLPYFLQLTLSFKLLFLIFHIVLRQYYRKIQNIRSIFVQFLHFILLLAIMLNQRVIKQVQSYKLFFSQNFNKFYIQIYYSSILGLVICLAIAFYVREVQYRLKADFRKYVEIEIKKQYNQVKQQVQNIKDQIEDQKQQNKDQLFAKKQRITVQTNNVIKQNKENQNEQQQLQDDQISQKQSQKQNPFKFNKQKIKNYKQQQQSSQISYKQQNSSDNYPCGVFDQKTSQTITLQPYKYKIQNKYQQKILSQQQQHHAIFDSNINNITKNSLTYNILNKNNNINDNQNQNQQKQQEQQKNKRVNNNDKKQTQFKSHRKESNDMKKNIKNNQIQRNQADRQSIQSQQQQQQNNNNNNISQKNNNKINHQISNNLQLPYFSSSNNKITQQSQSNKNLLSNNKKKISNIHKQRLINNKISINLINVDKLKEFNKNNLNSTNNYEKQQQQQQQQQNNSKKGLKQKNHKKQQVNQIQNVVDNNNFKNVKLLNLTRNNLQNKQNRQSLINENKLNKTARPYFSSNPKKDSLLNNKNNNNMSHSMGHNNNHKKIKNTHQHKNSFDSINHDILIINNQNSNKKQDQIEENFD